MRGVAALKGIVLAVANLLVIGIGLGVAEHKVAMSLVFLAYVGGPPTVMLGGLFALLADRPAARHWRMLLALAAVAWPAVGLAAVIPVVCVPTFVAALVLERWTRQVAPVPVATARSPRT